ncbi:hypothetical protein SDC9_178627 [bioreactor metagenome]|uniref:Uncharacterized protein n=1 Tax=bioreactor metagenome TaxID=1076179 RepID=A0A645H5M3_9ZZZZ
MRVLAPIWEASVGIEVPMVSSSARKQMSALEPITAGSSAHTPQMKSISGRVSRTLSMAAAAPGTACTNTMAFTSGSEARATTLAMVVSVSVEKLSG